VSLAQSSLRALTFEAPLVPRPTGAFRVCVAPEWAWATSGGASVSAMRGVSRLRGVAHPNVSEAPSASTPGTALVDGAKAARIGKRSLEAARQVKFSGSVLRPHKPVGRYHDNCERASYAAAAVQRFAPHFLDPAR
jgi:hypothetical protein